MQEIQYDYLWKDGPEMAQSDNIRFGTDSVLLGNFATLSGAKKGIDFGCASGIITLLLLSRSEKLHMTGIELDEKAAALAKTNMEHNGLEGRSDIINGDIREYKKLFTAGSFDFVISNPPYFPLCSGVVSPDARRAAAREETTCTLEDICSAAEYLCRWDGKFFVVYKPERLVELFSCMCAHGIEPKRMRIVSHMPGAMPSLVLVEGRRGGRTGMKLESDLFICNPDGTETEEIKTIYHRN